jgi:hypothetical protein
MSVATHLSEVAASLVVEDSEGTSIDRSIVTLRSRISAWFEDDVTQQLRFGSSTRGTMLPRRFDDASDVDYMVIFANAADKTPDSVTARLRRFAETAYGTSEIYQSHPTVVLSLNHIKFDLVPAYKDWLGTYNIPSKSAFINWTPTVPNDINSSLDSKNRSKDYQFRPLVRVLKYWNALNERVFDSYELEKFLVGNYFVQSTLKGMFYEAIADLTLSWDAAEWRRDKLDRAKRLAAEAKMAEDDGLSVTAETTVQRLIPR